MRSRRHEGSPVFLLVTLVAAALPVVAVGAETRRARRIVQSEDQGLVAVEALARAEQRHARRTGTFAAASALVPADFSEGSGAAPAFTRSTSGYDLDVLLPWRSQGGVVVYVARPEQHPPHPELSRRHVLVVGRPREPGVTGYRTFAVDEGGFVWLSEGISDGEALRRNPLPSTLPAVSGAPDERGRIWHRRDLMRQRGEDD